MTNKKVISTLGIRGGELLIDPPHIYVTDSVDHKVIKMDMKGSVVASTGSRGNGAGQFNFRNGIQTMKYSYAIQITTESKSSIKI